MTGMRLPIRAVFAAVVAVLLTGVAACSGDEDPDLPEPGPPQPTVEQAQAPTLTAEEQQAVDEVKTLFDEFLTVYVEIVTAGEPGTDDVLARLPAVSGDALFLVNNEIVDNFLAERRVEGQLAWEFVEVVEIDMDNVATIHDEERTVPVLRLRYCVDGTDWVTVDKSAGSPVDPGEHRLLEKFGERYLVTVRASYFDPDPFGPGDNPYWEINEWVNEPEEPC